MPSTKAARMIGKAWLSYRKYLNTLNPRRRYHRREYWSNHWDRRKRPRYFVEDPSGVTWF